jgi:UDP-glucose 4-epimerase
MHVLVTGAAGRVGRTLVPDLLARGHTVATLDLARLDLAHPGLTQVQGAFDDAGAVARAIAGAEAVLHIGAFMSWLAADVDRLYAANVTGTWTLLRAATAARVRRFVFASSGEVYPETKPKAQPIGEDHPTEPTSAYGLTKLLGEEMVTFHARSAGLETVILRFSHTQDADELLDPTSFFSGPRFYLRARIRQQEAFGNAAVVAALAPHDDGTEKLLVSRGRDGTVFRMPITDTRDIVAGLVAALENPAAAGHTLNLGTPDAIRFDEAVALLQRATGLAVVDVVLPVPAVDYVTSRTAAIDVLGVTPQWSFARMVEDAARRRGGRGPA